MTIEGRMNRIVGDWARTFIGAIAVLGLSAGVAHGAEATTEEIAVAKASPETEASPSLAPTVPSLTFDFRDTDVKDALRAIATTEKLSIVVDPQVTGRVTVRLLNIPLDVALADMLEQIGAEYRLERGVYRVSKKASTVSTEVIVVKDGKLSLDVANVEIKQVLQGIASQAGVNIVAAQGVNGPVSIHLKKLPLETGLDALCSSMGLLVGKTSAGLYRVFPAQGQGAAPGQVYAQVQNGQLTVDVTNADLAELVKSITRQTGEDLVLFGQVHESVTARFTQHSLDEALGIIFSGSKYAYRRVGNVMLVGDPSAGAAESKALTAMETIPLDHIKAEDAVGLLPAGLAQLQIKVVKEQNSLAVMAMQTQIDALRGFLLQVDKQAPQVMIEAMVVEFSKNASKNFGLTGIAGANQTINFGQLTKGKVKDSNTYGYTEQENLFPFSLSVGSVGALPVGFSARLNAAIQDGKAKVKANPKIATISGHHALINVGSVNYYQVTGAPQQQAATGQTTIITQYPQVSIQSISAGITLDITPWVSSSGEITTDLAPDVSNSVGTGPGGLPEVSQRRVSTTLKVHDGDTIVIGGLIQATESSSKDKIPLLGDIPLLGYLFSHETKTEDESELEIYITPRVLPLVAPKIELPASETPTNDGK